MIDKTPERRAHPRFPKELAGHIVGHKGHEAIALRTYNISCSGLYCHVPVFVPPFTRLKVAVFMHPPAGHEAEPVRLEFDGVVVRTVPEEETAGATQYHLAIFFDGITEKQRALIHQCLEANP